MNNVLDELVEESVFGNVVNHKNSGIRRAVLENSIQIISCKEWVCDRQGKLVYNEVVGPQSAVVSELSFLYQQVMRHLAVQELSNNFDGLSIVFNDISYLDAYEIYTPTFKKLGMLEGVIDKENVSTVKKYLGFDLEDFLGWDKLNLLNHFFENPSLISNNVKSDSELFPDHYFMLISKPSVCVSRAMKRDRHKKLSEGDLKYARLIRKYSLKVYKSFKKDFITLIDTTHLTPEKVSEQLFDNILKKLEKEKNSVF